MGAWIEIEMSVFSPSTSDVAPRVGAWIEIEELEQEINIKDVAPRVGAWIEIFCECDALRP